jgi:formylglycine-generating enzyme required for sulfatase activity
VTSDERSGEDPRYSQLNDYAWYAANSGGTTHPVGQKVPNSWGLHEMHGHVFEWCQDSYGPYPGGNSRSAMTRRSIRVFRGGLWDGSATYCRSAFRGHSVPSGRSSYIGFRVVLVIDE